MLFMRDLRARGRDAECGVKERGERGERGRERESERARVSNEKHWKELESRELVVWWFSFAPNFPRQKRQTSTGRIRPPQRFAFLRTDSVSGHHMLALCSSFGLGFTTLCPGTHACQSKPFSRGRIPARGRPPRSRTAPRSAGVKRPTPYAVLCAQCALELVLVWSACDSYTSTTTGRSPLEVI